MPDFCPNRFHQFALQSAVYEGTRDWIPLVTLALSLPFVLLLREITFCSSPSCKPLLSLEALAWWCRALGGWGWCSLVFGWHSGPECGGGMGEVDLRGRAFWIPPHFPLSTCSRYPLVFSVYVLEVLPPVNEGLASPLDHTGRLSLSAFPFHPALMKWYQCPHLISFPWRWSLLFSKGARGLDNTTRGAVFHLP